MIRNFTPHTLNVVTKREEFEFKSEGTARVNEKNEAAGNINGIPCVIKSYTDVSGLPDPEEGVFLAVSIVVFNASDREDLICPDTGPESVIRHSDGRIKAVSRFIRKDPDVITLGEVSE